jgi:anti-sigma B factor antagonist
VRATDRRSADGPFRVVELAGEADAASRQLKDALDAEVRAGPPLLVIDMSRLTFMDSWALHVILAAWKRLRAAGCVLALAGPVGSVRRVLDLAGADTVVGVYASVREAASLSRTAPAAGGATPPPATRG